MLVNIQSLNVLAAALYTNNEGGTRQYSFTEIKTAGSIHEKIQASIEGNGLKGGVEQIEIELNTDEKKLLKDSIQAKKWQAGDGVVVLSLIEELNK